MLAATLGVTLVVAQSVLGGSAGSTCAACGVEKSAMFDQIERLQTSPNWREREKAAHALRRFDWRCHPEVAEVLATALLTDRHEEVREESAQSLTKMAPCVPIVHTALNRAASLERDRATRHWAKKGLKALNHRCDAPCAACGGPVVAGPVRIERVLPVVPSAPEKVLPPAVDSRVEPVPSEPVPKPATPQLDEPRLEPATSSNDRPRRTGIPLLGARSLFRSR
ncbi:MAG: HEAT repeat domain-containing protein [Isosphaeraceae bacterium]|nr:HEAT repeat domain-containing protein [Isosphaeraceae bacterium]